MDAAIKIILEYGLLGAAIIALSGVVLYMNKRQEAERKEYQEKLDKKDAENDALHRELQAMQERWRLSDVERADRTIEAFNASIAVQKALTEKIELGKRSI